MSRPATLPTDRRFRQGGYLFLASLTMFFVSSIIIYGLYAYWRRNDFQSRMPLPRSFLISTASLLLISILAHIATRTIRRERRTMTATLLGISTAAALVFLAVQFLSMGAMLNGPAMVRGTGKGIVGMVAVLAFLHALHVIGGIVALGIVSVRSMQGRYDHERHWPVDFAAQYWHFLDVVWLSMLLAFWLTSGGF